MSTFKRKQTKQLRKRRHSSSDDQDSDSGEEVGTKIEDLKALQKLRDKQKGVNVVGLALGKKIDKAEEIADQNDPFKMKTGGFVDMKSLKPHQMVTEDGEAIGTAFAAETNRRDEDAEMLRFVEDELAKRRGRALSKKEEEEVSSQEDTLYQLPDRLRLDSAKRSEDMLSNQMLSGIPEIDLGIHAKIKNIEATEDAKQKLLRERMRKKDSEVSDFVPTNMAVNFVQHNRFTIEDTAPSQKQVKVEVAPPKPVRVGDADDAEPPPENPSRSGKSSKDKNSGEKATDDFHYEKFKKQMRRY